MRKHTRVIWPRSYEYIIQYPPRWDMAWIMRKNTEHCHGLGWWHRGCTMENVNLILSQVCMCVYECVCACMHACGGVHKVERDWRALRDSVSYLREWHRYLLAKTALMSRHAI